MTNDEGKRKASSEEPEIPPHMVEGLSPAQRKALGIPKHAREVEKEPPKKK